MSTTNWTDRLPDGVEHVETDSTGFKVGVTLPMDEEGMFGLHCPEVPEHRFAVPRDRGAASDPVFCPHCGRTGDIWEFMPAEAMERVQAASRAVAEQYVHDAMADMARSWSQTPRRSGGMIQVRFSASVAPPPPRRVLPDYVPDPSRRLKTCSRCTKTYSVFGIAVFCAMCGRLTPVDELAEVIQVQRAVLDLIAAQQSAQADRLRADGTADRIRESSVKDAATALEVFLREVFTAKVPNAAQVAGNGNPFQNLTRADSLYTTHLGVALSTLTGDWPALTEGMAVRHILTHTGGIVDDRFLLAVPHSRFGLGQRVHVSDTDARDFVDAVETLCAALDAALP